MIAYLVTEKNWQILTSNKFKWINLAGLIYTVIFQNFSLGVIIKKLNALILLVSFILVSI